MNITLFTYDRPHWKTQQFIYELISLNLTPRIIVAAPWRDLGLPLGYRMSVKHYPHHPQELARRFSIEYIVAPHDEVTHGQLGVIGGARILPPPVVKGFTVGILNMHPGLIPENRGLPNVAAAILNEMPQAVTAHMIDERIDAGRVLLCQEIEEDPDDTVWDILEKMMDLQVRLLGPAIQALLEGRGWDVPDHCGGYRRPMKRDEERRAVALWQERRAIAASRRPIASRSARSNSKDDTNVQFIHAGGKRRKLRPVSRTARLRFSPNG